MTHYIGIIHPHTVPDMDLRYKISKYGVSCHGDERSRCARRIIPSYVSGPNIFERSSARAVRAAVNTRRGALRSTTVTDARVFEIFVIWPKLH